jgi:hypothetical protein
MSVPHRVLKDSSAGDITTFSVVIQAMAYRLGRLWRPHRSEAECMAGEQPDRRSTDNPCPPGFHFAFEVLMRHGI